MLARKNLSLIISLCSIGTIQTQERCLVIGHRGACGYAPENTLSSFVKALELGVDMIELDVHLCASGELVVIHDDTVHRTTNGTGYVQDKTKNQLDALTISSSEHIPTLKEVIDIVHHRAKIAIELKGQGTAEPTARLMQAYLDQGWQPDEFYVLSFDHVQLQEFHSLLPQIKRCATVNGMPLEFAAYAKKHGFQAISTKYEYVTQRFVDDAHAHGLKVFIYTANDSRIIKQLLCRGVDGIFSDYPDRIQKLLTAADEHNATYLKIVEHFTRWPKHR